MGHLGRDRMKVAIGYVRELEELNHVNREGIEHVRRGRRPKPTCLMPARLCLSTFALRASVDNLRLACQP
jgi:hypothetical protein